MNAVSVGFRRGVFSNEAGLGSSVAVNASSDVTEPVKQGMWAVEQGDHNRRIFASLRLVNCDRVSQLHLFHLRIGIGHAALLVSSPMQ